jgi:mRNA interferase MazF
MNKGEIWIVDFPQSNGHEQSGKRPVIVLSDTATNIVIIIPLTSNFQALHFPHTLEIEATKENGLATKSVALVFHIRAIDKKRLLNKLGNLEPETLKRLEKMLKNLLMI